MSPSSRTSSPSMPKKVPTYSLSPITGGFLVSEEMLNHLYKVMVNPTPYYPSSYRFKEKLTGHDLEEWCKTFINDGSARLSLALNHATRPERLES